MTIGELLDSTKPNQLVAIRDHGYLTNLFWFDSNSYIEVSEYIRAKQVKNEQWAFIRITGQHGDTVLVPCHYVDL